MSERTNPLGAIEAMEAAAFRTGQAARQMLAEHPDLPVQEIRPGYSTGGRAELAIHAGDCDSVRAWAERLGLEAEAHFGSYTYPTNGYEMVYEACHAKGTVLGAQVDISGTRSVEGAERESWIAAGDEGSGGDA